MYQQSKTIIIGTRGSRLALWQTRWVARRLRRLFPAVRIEERIIKTTGDLRPTANLAALEQKGVFTKEIDDALLAGAIDLAVHSMKDLPAELPAGLEIAAVPRRADPHDVLVSLKYRSLAALPPGVVLGTGSPRREAQLLAHYPDFQCKLIRGNVDTRIQKLEEGRYDALILAAAGLRRLGWSDRIAQIIPYSIMLPAPGQGALAIVGRKGARKQLQALSDPQSLCAVLAERALLRAVQGGCQLPLGALARIRRGILRLDAAIAIEPHKKIFRLSAIGDMRKPEELGRRVGRLLLAAKK